MAAMTHNDAVMTGSAFSASERAKPLPLPLKITSFEAAKQYAAVMFPGVPIHAHKTGRELGAYDPHDEMGLLILRNATKAAAYDDWPEQINTMFQEVARISPGAENAYQVKARQADLGKVRIYDSVQFTQHPCICRSCFGGDRKLGQFTSAT